MRPEAGKSYHVSKKPIENSSDYFDGEDHKTFFSASQRHMHRKEIQLVTLIIDGV